MALLLPAFALAGAACASMHARQVLPPDPAGTVEVEAAVVEASRLADRTRALLEVRHERRDRAWRRVRYRLRLTAAGPALLAGDRVRARLRLEVPPPAMNPGAPDWRARARAEGVAAFATVDQGQLSVLGPPSPVQARVARLRTRFGALVELALPDPASGALIRALALGDRTQMPAELDEDFAASGLAHVLSVSGLHIAVVAAGLFFALRRLLSRSERLLLTVDVRAVAALAAVPATWAYVVITGSEVPAVRSGLMATAVFAAMALGRDEDGLTSLAAALLLVLGWDPSALQSLSFRLSFAAVAGLLVLARPIRALIPFAPPSPDARGLERLARRTAEAVLQTFAASLAASLATAPFVAAAFHRTSVVSVVANCVALPVASALTVVCASAGMLFGFWEDASALLVFFADPLARALAWLSTAFASLPCSILPAGAPGTTAVLGWAGLLAAIALREHRRRLAGRLALVAAAALAAVAAHGVVGPLLRRELVVTFLAVGQGDCALVQLPGGRNLLVDGGGSVDGSFDPGERIVTPALIELGAADLDAVLLSHPHPDHARGLVSVVRRLRVRELWIGERADPGPLLDELLAAAAERGVRVRRLGPGPIDELRELGGEVLHPREGGLAANDASLVVRLALGGVSFLFAGDLEQAGEQALLSRPLPQTTVIKVPHHGSRSGSSPELLASLAPRHAVVSVGRNRFGLPSREVVERYRAAGAELHRTDLHGAVTIRTDGVSLRAEHYAP